MSLRNLLSQWDEILKKHFNVHTLFLIYLVSMCATHGRILDEVKFPICLISFLGIVFPRTPKDPFYWLILSGFLVYNLFFSYAYSANHYFLATYVNLCLCVDTYYKQSGFEPRVNMARGLLTVLFFFATLQKILSAHFVSGRLIANYFLKGGSFRRTLETIYPGFEADVIRAYDTSFDQVSDTALLQGDAVALHVPDPSFILLCKALTISIVVAELAVFIIYASKRIFRTRVSEITTIGFVLGTAMFRGEFSFFSLLCILFLMAKPSVGSLFKAMLIMMVFFFLSLDVSEVRLTL